MDLKGIKENKYNISNELKCGDTPILKYSINYPQFYSEKYMQTLKWINYGYAEIAKRAANYCETKLYKEALSYCADMKKNDFPIHEYEFNLNYTTTSSEGCVLSLYFDEWRYTGGANGSDTRFSDTRNLITGEKIMLYEFYPTCPAYEYELKENITGQISAQIKNENANYFDDYENLVNEYFSDSNFYLEGSNLVIYFEEMTIAPHSSGIVTFSFPLVDGPIYPVLCR